MERPNPSATDPAKKDGPAYVSQHCETEHGQHPPPELAAQYVTPNGHGIQNQRNHEKPFTRMHGVLPVAPRDCTSLADTLVFST